MDSIHHGDGVTDMAGDLAGVDFMILSGIHFILTGDQDGALDGVPAGPTAVAGVTAAGAGALDSVMAMAMVVFTTHTTATTTILIIMTAQHIITEEETLQLDIEIQTMVEVHMQEALEI